MPEPSARTEPGPQPTGTDSDLYSLLESRKTSVVSRQEIAQSVWPDVTNETLANQVIDQSVERLRALIEDDPSKPMHLITVGEIGFVLV